MAFDREDMLRKIRAVLRKAEDAAVGSEEAESFRAHAIKLMVRYDIDDALLSEEEVNERDITHVTFDWGVSSDLKWHGDRTRVMAEYCRAAGCRLVRHRNRMLGRKRNYFISFTIIGKGHMPEMLRDFILIADVSMMTRMEAEARAYRDRELTDYGIKIPGPEMREWRRSWLYGFLVELSDRIDELLKAARIEENDGNSFVPALIARDKVLDEYLASLVPDAKVAVLRRSNPVDEQAAAAGEAAGMSAPLPGTSPLDSPARGELT